MPQPQKGETQADYMARCVKMLVDTEGLTQEQAVGKCEGMFKGAEHGCASCQKLMELDGEYLSIEMADTRLPAEHTETADEEVYKATVLVADRFYKGKFMPLSTVQKAYKQLDGSYHDINHFGTTFPGALGKPTQNIEYIVGYQKDTQLDPGTKRVTTDVHISKKAANYAMWKGFMDINRNAGRVPNVSVSFFYDEKPVKVRDLPGGAEAYANEGYTADQTVPMLDNLQFRAVSTVMKGACNEHTGCGIGLSEETPAPERKKSDLSERDEAARLSLEIDIEKERRNHARQND